MMVERTRKAAARARKKRNLWKKRLKSIGLVVLLGAVIWTLHWAAGKALHGFGGKEDGPKEDWQQEIAAEEYEDVVELLGQDVVSGSSREDLLGLQGLLEHNEEAMDFVLGYPDRETYKNEPIDLTQDYEPGKVPLLMQWDRRWGYNLYGDSMIGLAGCGPTCLTMAYLYFTGDLTENPRTMAEFAYENGFFLDGGTSWDLWTRGAGLLGLKGEEIPLDQGVMERALDAGSLIVCSMRPGDFTTTGHFILLTGYDEDGFFVNDPNRLSTSGKQWAYDVLNGQIKNLWALSE